MPLKSIVVGTNPDGSNRYQHIQEPLDPNKPVVVTGPYVNGVVELGDGTAYDLTQPAVELASWEHAGELNHVVGVRFENEGHPQHTPDEPFVHYCTSSCGALKRSASDPRQVKALEQVRATHKAITDKNDAAAFAEAHELDTAPAKGASNG